MQLEDQVDLLLQQSGHSMGSPAPAQQHVGYQQPAPASSMVGGGGQHFEMSPHPGGEQHYSGHHHQAPAAGYSHQGGYGQPEEYTGRSHFSGDDSPHGSPGSQGATGSNIPGYDRIQRWAARKQSRLKELEDAKEGKRKQDCPFQPNRYPVTRDLADLSPSQLYEDNKAWGYDEFIDRAHSGRRRREEQQSYERNFWANDSRWTGKETVPEPFELSDVVNSRKPQVASLKKTYDQVAPGVRQHHGQEASEIEPTSVPSGLFSCKTSQSIMELSPDRHQGRTTRSVMATTALPGESPMHTARSGTSGIVIITAEERGMGSPQMSGRTGGSVSARGATPPSSHRSKFGVGATALTPHKQLPI